MKSAFEKAMERLEQAEGPGKRLTPEQKDAIAEIENKYEAAVAEAKIGFDARLAAATNAQEYDETRADMVREMARLEEKRNADKEAVWSG